MIVSDKLGVRVRFLSRVLLPQPYAIPAGADISEVFSQWISFVLVDPNMGVIQYVKGYPNVYAVIERVAQLWHNGGTLEEFTEVRNMAMTVPGLASTLVTRAAFAALVVAETGGSPFPTWDAGVAAVRAMMATEAVVWEGNSSCRDAWIKTVQEKLLELLKNAPVGN
jgi:hypothetical protein